MFVWTGGCNRPTCLETCLLVKQTLDNLFFVPLSWIVTWNLVDLKTPGPLFEALKWLLNRLGVKFAKQGGGKLVNAWSEDLLSFLFCVFKKVTSSKRPGRAGVQCKVISEQLCLCLFVRCVFQDLIVMPCWEKPDKKQTLLKEARKPKKLWKIPQKPQERIALGGGETSNPDGLVVQPPTLEIPQGYPQTTPWKNEGRTIIKNPLEKHTWVGSTTNRIQHRQPLNHSHGDGTSVRHPETPAFPKAFYAGRGCGCAWAFFGGV